MLNSPPYLHVAGMEPWPGGRAKRQCWRGGSRLEGRELERPNDLGKTLSTSDWEQLLCKWPLSFCLLKRWQPGAMLDWSNSILH